MNYTTIYRCSFCQYETSAKELIEGHVAMCPSDPARKGCSSCANHWRSCMRSVQGPAPRGPVQQCHLWLSRNK